MTTMQEAFEQAGLDGTKVEETYEGQNVFKDMLDAITYSVAEQATESYRPMMLTFARLMSHYDDTKVALLYAVGNYQPRNDRERETLEELLRVAKSPEVLEDPAITRFQFVAHASTAPDYENPEEIKKFQQTAMAVGEMLRPRGYERGKELYNQAVKAQEEFEARLEEDRQKFETAAKFAGLQKQEVL